MTRKSMISAAAALLAGASFVGGAVSPAMAHSDPAKKQEEASAASKAKAGERKYCVKPEFTGTRLRAVQCYSREAYIERFNVDPETANKR